ncbi:TrmH family RNA methyltransferase [Clostridium sp. DL1XJH146]
MREIKSRDNLLLKDIKKLQTKKYRQEKNLFVIEGLRFVQELVFSNFNIKYLFVEDNYIEKFSNIINQCMVKKNVDIIKVDNKLLSYISTTKNPQGILAVVEMKQYIQPTKKGLYVLLDRIQDPGNMGTIIRTSHAAGVAGVIITKGSVDLYNDKTLRSTMGSVFKIPIFNDFDINELKDFKRDGFKLVVSSLDTEFNFYDVNYDDDVILAIGNEANGLCDEIIDIADIKVKIPMPGGAESLNAAVAGSIMIYEMLRQKK